MVGLIGITIAYYNITKINFMENYTKIPQTVLDDIIEKLRCYKHHYVYLIKCRKCTGYYVKDYVCSCGEDNSTKQITN